jgi:hypothetical protein
MVLLVVSLLVVPLLAVPVLMVLLSRRQRRMKLAREPTLMKTCRASVGAHGRNPI